jgi:hypothetical protein
VSITELAQYRMTATKTNKETVNSIKVKHKVSKNMYEFTNCINSRNTSSQRTMTGEATEDGKVRNMNTDFLQKQIIIPN